MRHHIVGYQLNRDTTSRRALFKNLLSGLIEHGSLVTTKPKAKAIQGRLDKLITKAKRGRVSDLRQIDRVLNQRSLVNKLVKQIAPKTGSRVSGFTRIIKLVSRPGDQADMARIEFVDSVIEVKPPVQPPVKAAKKTETDKSKTKVKTATAKKPVITTPSPIQKQPKAKNQAAVTPVNIRQKSGER